MTLPHHFVSLSGGQAAPPRRGFTVILRTRWVSPTPQLRLHALHAPQSPTLQSLGKPERKANNHFETPPFLKNLSPQNFDFPLLFN